MNLSAHEHDTFSSKLIYHLFFEMSNNLKLFHLNLGAFLCSWGPFGTVPELLFEKKQLIPDLQRLLVQADDT